MASTLIQSADTFVKDHAVDFARLFAEFGRSLGDTSSVESDLRAQVSDRDIRVDGLVCRMSELEDELCRRQEEMKRMHRERAQVVADAEKRQAQLVTQQITSQMQSQYERIRSEHRQSQQVIVTLRGEMETLQKDNQTLVTSVQEMEVAQSTYAVQKVQSNLVGASQEEFLMATLMECFPFGRVEDVSRTPKSMDIHLTLPTVNGRPPCVIAIESKARKKSNVESAELQKFERDFSELEGVDGAILVARRRVDVIGGRSEELCHNLRRASPSTLYVDNCCTEALVRACMVLYAQTIQPSASSATVVAGGEAVNELQLEMVNEALRQSAGYIRTQNDLIAQFYQPLRSHYLHHTVTADPLAASLVNLRNVLDGVQTEQVIHSLSLKGSGTVKKKKRKLCDQ